MALPIPRKKEPSVAEFVDIPLRNLTKQLQRKKKDKEKPDLILLTSDLHKDEIKSNLISIWGYTKRSDELIHSAWIEDSWNLELAY